MPHFSPNLDESTDEQLKQAINIAAPQYGSLASDELTRRSLDKLQKSFDDFDKSTSKFSKILGALALIQIVIAGFQLVLDLESYSNKILSIFIAISFALTLVWITKSVNKILDQK